VTQGSPLVRFLQSSGTEPRGGRAQAAKKQPAPCVSAERGLKSSTNLEVKLTVAIFAWSPRVHK